MTATLFRPVGLHELALIWDSEMREFPPRLAHQPIFYPVVTMEYATQIARAWNTRDEGSGFAGFVTQFTVALSYLREFEPQVAGSSSHVEYWIPAEHLPEFNAAIRGSVSIVSAYFGKDFKGCIPEKFGLHNKDAVQQFVSMFRSWDYSTMDFICEVSANRKAVFLNFLFWAQYDFTPFGIDREQRDATLARFREACFSIILKYRSRPSRATPSIAKKRYCPAGPLEIRENCGFSRREIAQIEVMLTDHLIGLCGEWESIHEIE